MQSEKSVETQPQTTDAIETRVSDARASEFYNPLFALAASIFSAYFLTQAAGTCPLTAPESKINQAQCTLSLVFSIGLAIVCAISCVGIYRQDSNEA